MNEGQKPPMWNAPYWQPMVRAYNLSRDDCTFLERLATTEGRQKNRDGGVCGASVGPKLKKRFNVETRDKLIPYAEWLMSGDCPVIDGSETLIATCIPHPEGCGVTQNINSFPFWPLDDRCAVCIHRASHEPLTGEAIQRANRAMSRLQSLGRCRTPSPAKGSEVAGYLSQMAKGAKGVAQEIWETHNRLKEDPKKNTSKTLVDLQLGLFRVLLELERAEREARPTDEMSTEELRAYAKRLLLDELEGSQREMFEQAYLEAEAMESQRAQAEFGPP